MKRSQLFVKTRREAPADEEARNAQLLIRAGFIHKEMAGVYSFLPLGKMVIDNINQIIREEMDRIGGNEVLMSTLQHKDLWEATGRWDDQVVDNWFKSKLINGTEVGIGFTHEEPIVNMLKNFVSSYKDLPVYPYQIQTKFRNELRAKSGLMRGREFLMKDMYSFSRSQAEHDEFYERCAEAYLKVYARLGFGDITYRTFASGGVFSKFSDEFQILSHVGEDTIYVHKDRRIAINKEVYTDEVLAELKLSRDELVEEKAVEAGNIFPLGSKYSDALGLSFTDEDGQNKPIIMGCYGIGVSRMMGLIAEHFADDNGLAWPTNVAPMHVYLCRLGDEPEVVQAADEAYDKLRASGITVLYDDRDDRPGAQFADADLIGLPYRLVVSKKSLASGGFELKKRTEEQIQILDSGAVMQILGKALQA
ncbi:MAG TPA: aminoacyl--tRNA ligase-related protein [Candidatus Saccharimonadales bacterium]|nr:aminoacyl--tRNA ligase-related protein [Candidatus Saccharimonadales bacterium]